jgi:uncharacterized protein
VVHPSHENRPIVRLVPDEPFPPYAFVPGRFPHPVSDPAGHSHGIEPAPPPALDPERWQESKCYLFGIDLFNGGFYWESHVQLESLWLAAGRKGTVADFLKGFIKLAAAGVKHLEGRPAGVKSHACRAAELWREVARSVGTSDRLFLGFRLGELIALAEAVCREGWPEPAPVLVPELP